MSRMALQQVDAAGVAAASPGRRGLWPWRRRERVVRRGVLASVVAPLAGALALLLLVAGLALFGTQWWAGFSRDALFGQTVKPDASVATIETGRPLEETVTLLLRDEDGTLRRLVVERTAADRFVNDTLRRLDAERERSQALASVEVAAILALAFADADEAVERYADWFFSWKRSYVVLKEAVVSTATRLVQLGGYEPLQVAVERDLESYFMRHYVEQVLRPEHRDPLIAGAFEATARRAHERWLAVLAEQDLRLRLFLAEHTRHLEEPAPGQRLSAVTLDWDAQRFKAPRHLTADKAFDGLVGVATIGGGTAAGALALGPAAQLAARRALAGLAPRYAASLAGRVAATQAGAAVGTAVQPVGGTAIGALAGGLIGLAADYALNEATEAFDREAFVTANREAVALTASLWEDRLTTALATAIDRWFADTRAAVVEAR
jgi:hypothetical protein